MVSEHAAGFAVIPFPANHQSVHRSDGVRAACSVADVPGGPDLRGRNQSAFAASEASWPVSVLARFLAPQCGTLLADTLAQRLIDRFGSLARAVAAPLSAIEQVCGQATGAAEAIAQARELMLAASAEHVVRTEVNVSDPQLHSYLRLRMMRLAHEELFVVFLDASRKFIHARTFCTQQTNNVTVQMDKIYRKAIELGAYGILLAHNHPSGDHTPSVEDCRANDQFRQIGAALNVTLADHLIIAGSTIFSMREGRAI